MERFGIVVAACGAWLVSLAVLYGLFAFVDLDPYWMFRAPGESTGYSGVRFVFAFLGLILAAMCFGAAQERLSALTAAKEG